MKICPLFNNLEMSEVKSIIAARISTRISGTNSDFFFFLFLLAIFNSAQICLNYFFAHLNILVINAVQFAVICVRIGIDAVFVIREVRIAGRSIYNVECKVVSRMIERWVIGQKTMKQLGNFEFDTKSQKLIFK